MSRLVRHRVERLQVAAVLIERDLESFTDKELAEAVANAGRGRSSRPVMAVMPLTPFDDWESVSLATKRSSWRSSSAHGPARGIGARSRW